MGPTTPVSVLSAGGSKNATVPCVATRYLRMQCMSVACSPGVATSSRWKMGLSCQDSCSKEKRLRNPHGLFLPDLPIPTIERSPKNQDEPIIRRRLYDDPDYHDSLNVTTKSGQDHYLPHETSSSFSLTISMFLCCSQADE